MNERMNALIPFYGGGGNSISSGHIPPKYKVHETSKINKLSAIVKVQATIIKYTENNKIKTTFRIKTFFHKPK